MEQVIWKPIVGYESHRGYAIAYAKGGDSYSYSNYSKAE